MCFHQVSMRGMCKTLQKGCFERLELAFLGYRMELCGSRVFGYKRLIELVSADLLYPKLTVVQIFGKMFCKITIYNRSKTKITNKAKTNTENHRLSNFVYHENSISCPTTVIASNSFLDKKNNCTERKLKNDVFNT